MNKSISSGKVMHRLVRPALIIVSVLITIAASEIYNMAQTSYSSKYAAVSMVLFTVSVMLLFVLAGMPKPRIGKTAHIILASAGAVLLFAGVYLLIVTSLAKYHYLNEYIYIFGGWLIVDNILPLIHKRH